MTLNYTFITNRLSRQSEFKDEFVGESGEIVSAADFGRISL